MEKQVLGHTIPPIIIKSVEDAPEPIEVESVTTLVENPALHREMSSQLKLYTMPDFGKTRYVEVFRETATGDWESKHYENPYGLEVKMWLQHYTNGQWTFESSGPDLIVEGPSEGFSLTCERLSPDKKNPGDPRRRRKRSFNKNKKWRIGRVQVGNDTIDAITYMVVEFQDHI
jgi:hypothetical protein